jgi:hypothetical protein
VEYKRDSNHKGQIARTELVAGVTVQRVMVKIKVVQEIQGTKVPKQLRCKGFLHRVC